MSQSFKVTPIAWVRGARQQKRDDFWEGHASIIELDETLSEETLHGITAFSHLEIIFQFNRVEEADVCHGARHPRQNKDWPQVGIFAQRGKSRPNRLGLSRCRLVGCEDRRLYVLDLDAIDGTPILDIKPWMEEFGPNTQTHQPAWSRELMAHYYAPIEDLANDDS